MVLDSAIGPADISQLGHLPLNANSAPNGPHNSVKSLAQLVHHGEQGDILAGALWSGLLDERPAGSRVRRWRAACCSGAHGPCAWRPGPVTDPGLRPRFFSVLPTLCNFRSR